MVSRAKGSAMPVTVRDVMTSDLTTFPENATVQSAMRTMSEHQFDVAPVRVGEFLRKYVSIENLTASDETNTVIQVADTMHEKHFVGKDVPVLVLEQDGRDLLTMLDERNQHFAFVVGDGIEGIVTYADLNKSIAGTAFYHLISTFEDGVAAAVDSTVEHDTWLEYFSEDVQNDIKSRFKQGQRANADLRMSRFLTTGELSKLVVEYDVWEEIGFDGPDEARAVFSDIEDIRHSVMHPRPVVGKNSIAELHETCQEMKRLCENIG